MPRFQESQTFQLIRNIPPNMFGIVREALALRQKAVWTRQSLLFLQRCKSTGLLPRFITNKKLGSVCNLPDTHPRITAIYRRLLGVVIREKQYVLYSTLLKCQSKEDCCRRLLTSESWREIESESRRICDRIRSKAKASLKAKYDGLRSMDEIEASNAGTPRPGNHRPEHSENQSAQVNQNEARVTVIGNARVSDCALELLNLGPSFSPAQGIDLYTVRKIVGGLHRLTDQGRMRAMRNVDPGN